MAKEKDESKYVKGEVSLPYESEGSFVVVNESDALPGVIVNENDDKPARWADI